MKLSRIMTLRNENLLRRLAILGIGAIALAFLAAGGVSGDYQKFLVASIALNAVTVLSISILAGTSGVWSLGHAAFIAVGAYAATNLAAAGLPLEAILPLVICVAAMMGYFLGIAAGRFSILYFGLLTLSVALTAVEIIGRLSSFTGGDQGMSVGPMKSWLLATSFTSNNAPQACIVLATVVFLAADFVIKGATGQKWRAVKSQRMASSAIGISPFVANANAFAFSASIASVGGIATAMTFGFLDPQIFNLNSGIMLIVGTVVGGIGSFSGALIGALFIVGVPELGRNVPDIAAFVLGSTMILVLLLLPRGLAPSVYSFVSQSIAPRFRTENNFSGLRVDTEEISKLARELMPSCKKSLRVSNLSVNFGGLHVLNNISVSLVGGTTLGLIGPNGAGKTTFINVLSGFVKPSSCDALMFGETELSEVTPQGRLACGIGRTFQHCELFDELTVRETLAVAAGRRLVLAQGTTGPGEADIIVDRILGVLNLRNVADFHPNELPFGIKKVVDVARTLAAGAEFVALDEPFSGLDSSEIRELRAILVGLKSAGVSILMIDHAVQEVLNVADKILVLNFGSVLAYGDPSEVSKNLEVQAAYFGTTNVVNQKFPSHG